MNCKTCRYWTRLGWPDDLWGKCLRTIGTDGASEDNNTLAWVDSDSGRGWLTTYETFSCNQGKEKEEDP